MTTTPFILANGNLTQDWTNIGLITANDSWAGVPSITGYLGDTNTGSPTNVDARTELTDALNVDVIANQTNTTINNGGVAEFQLTDPVVALQGSGTADAPNIVLYLDATGRQDVLVAFNVRDIDSTTGEDAVQQVAVQYRLGTSGPWTRAGLAATDGYVGDATGAGATLVTPVSVLLPAAVNGRADLQVRILTTNAGGNDEWVGIDDITVSSGGGAATSIGIASAVTLAEGAAGATTPFSFTVTRSGDVTGTSTVAYATADGTATAGSDYAAQSGTLTFAPGETTKTVDVLVSGDGDTEPNETFTVTLSGATGAGLAGAVGTGTITNDDVGITRVFTIQGGGHRSTLVGQTVTTRGIVTAVDSNDRGFWLQDATGDGNTDTSDAVQVFYTAGTRPSSIVVGADVTVTGSVGEFAPVTASTSELTRTQLQTTATTPFTVNAPSVPLPAAVVVGTVNDPANGLRKAPTAAIGDNPNTGVFDTATQGTDFWESLEGMRVTIRDARATSPTQSSSAPFITANDPSNPGQTSRGGLTISDTTPERPVDQPATHIYDFNPENIVLSGRVNGVTLPGGINVGDRFGDVTGIVSSFTSPEIQPTQALTVTPGNLAREVTTIAPSLDRIALGGFNVENLAPTDADSKFIALAQAIVTNLGAPDILSLEEIQDNNGAGGGGETAADITLARLIAAIQSINGPLYAAIDAPPADGQDGGAPGGNIRSGYLYRADRVTPTESIPDPSGLGRPPGALTTSTTTETINGVTVAAVIKTFPTEYRIGADPDGPGPLSESPAFDNTRKSVPIEWTPTGYTPGQGGTFWTLNNHFSSKGGSEPLYSELLGPDSGPLFADQLNRLAIRREAQGEAVNAWADRVLANGASYDDRVVMLGDFNEFQFFPTLKIATGALTRTTAGAGNTPSTFAAGAAVLTNLTDTLPASERYTYSFGGNSQALDHVLVTNGLVATTLYDIVHFNSEFASQLSDHDPSVTSVLLPRSAAIATAGNDVIDQAAYTAKFGASASASLAGGDIIYALAGNDTVASGAGNDVVYGNEGDDVLYGNQNDDVLFGNQNNDVLYGGQGADALAGGQGDDALYGNLGDDVLEGGVGINRIDGADGADTASYASVPGAVTVSLLAAGAAQATGVSSDTLVAIENLRGSNFADVLTGDAAVNTLFGGIGADTLYGGFGGDMLYGEADGDSLFGNQDDDVLFGGAGQDLLYGGQGADQLWGGAGNDLLQGGILQDTFVFEAGFAMDLITDWSVGGVSDLIRFRPGTFASYGEVSAALSQSDTDALITLNTGDVVRILNTQASTLTAEFFTFG